MDSKYFIDKKSGLCILSVGIFEFDFNSHISDPSS